ncbi:MAG TPA: acyl-CoA dehydrogenase family protein [Sphingomonadales bacterium]|nr:acyl-CoA dehydrogenase family protein [Sphingomonadales bacterium]
MDFDYLEWPFFEARHRRLAGKAEAWARKNLDGRREPAEAELDTVCREMVALLARGGWLKYAVPKAYGGFSEGFDVRSLALIRETLARHFGLADFTFALQGLGSGAISLFGTGDQKKKYLPDVAAGKKIAAFALSEPKAGSDPASMVMQATKKAGTYVLDGQKTFVSNGGLADFYTVFARTGEGPKAKGISAFVVDAETPGLEIVERIPVISPHPLARIRFKNCKIPAANLLGQPGKGFKVAMATLDVFRITVAAAALGFAKRALHEAGKRAKGRKIFGAAMAELQMIQAMIAEMALKVDAAELLVYRAAWRRDVKGERVTKEAAMAKLYATEAAQRVIDMAVQIWGGMGVVAGQTVEKLYREIRALRIYEGASEVQKIVIARQHLRAVPEDASYE